MAPVVRPALMGSFMALPPEKMAVGEGDECQLLTGEAIIRNALDSERADPFRD
jgi:hypothetical protein